MLAVVERGQFFISDGLRSHFSVAEMMCPCCQVWNVEQGLIDTAERFRCLVQESVYVNSGYRCPKHNLEVDGARASRHMMGLAMDFRIKNKSIWTAFNFAIQVFPRVIIYPRRFIHVDIDETFGEHWYRVKHGDGYDSIEVALAAHPELSPDQIFGDFAA
jgi:hypothetical protein